jgi:hypothetical protein
VEISSIQNLQFLGFFPVMTVNFIDWISFEECTNFSQTSAIRSRKVMEFHNWGHNSQSDKYNLKL